MAPATTEPTAEDKRQSDMKRTGLFKGTIAVIVIYGSILLLMSLVGIFSEGARKTIFSDGFVFTVTLMAGIILVIIMLMVQVFTYKEVKREIVAGENLVCPEYWELKKTPQAELRRIADSKVRALSGYHCQSTTDTRFLNNTLTTSGTTQEANTLRSVANQYNASTLKLNCNRLYPEYMAYMDKLTFPDEPTKMRKEYLKQCSTTTQNTTASEKKVMVDWPAVSP
jgi:hypothetical protein